jgi:hypothetical protein
VGFRLCGRPPADGEASARLIRKRPSSRRVVASAGLWEPTMTCPGGQRIGRRPCGASRSPCINGPQIRASQSFGTAPSLTPSSHPFTNPS